jgi:hypothetical protein
MGQKALDVLLIAIPSNQAHDGKRVPKIMEPRLETGVMT